MKLHATSAKAGPDNVADTFGRILQARAAERPHRKAFVFLDSQGGVADELTFAELDRRARRIAEELMVSGLRDQRVLLMYPPGLDFITALFGCFYSGAVAVPLPYLTGKRAVERINAICRNADPAGVLTLDRIRKDPEVQTAFLGQSDEIVWIHSDALVAKPQFLPAPMPDAGDLAMLQYTSGSTSAPKGVMLSHANLVANSAMISEAFEHDETLRGVGWLPLFHDMGLVGHVLQPVYVGGLSVLMSPLSFLQRPARWLQAISKWKATTSGAPTHGFQVCLKAIRDEQLQDLDLSSWKLAYCGSEKIHGDVLEQFSNRFEPYGFDRRSLYPCYGLAEATLLVTGNRRGSGIRRAVPDPATEASTPQHPAVSCGSTWGNASVVIADPHSRIRHADGRIGEIWIQGRQVGNGYWRQAAASGETFQIRLADGSGPYLRTGDLGFIRNGELFIVGRIKDTIVIRGLKHAAEDIEITVARSHHSFAGLAGAAFGIEAGDQEHAVVVQEVDRKVAQCDDQDEAIASAFECITRQHGLRLLDLVLVRVGALPRTSSGKVQRARARAIYSEGGFKRLNQPSPSCSINSQGSAIRSGTWS